MSQPMMLVVGRGEAAEPQMDLFNATARSTVRYADALSWTAATAVSLALRGTTDELRSIRHQTGLITISAEGPAKTIADLAETSASGFSSPLRYPAAGPGALGGVVCIMHELRGPTMNLTMPPAMALSTALVLASSWIVNHSMSLVVVLVSRGIGGGKYRARCMLLAPAGVNSESGGLFAPSHSAWLLSETGT